MEQQELDLNPLSSFGDAMAIACTVKDIGPRHLVIAFLLGAILITSFTTCATASAQATTPQTSPPACEAAKGKNSSHTGNFYSGETHFQVTNLQWDCSPLANTHLVILRQKQVDKTIVSTDQSIAGRLHTKLFLREDPDSPEASNALVQQVRKSFTKSLVKNLNDLHFVADADPASNAHEGDAIIIEIEMTEIVAGNQSKRVMIGLGSGASQVAAKVTLLSRRDGKELPLQEIVLNSQSGKKLGALASPPGASLAVNAAAGDVGDRKSTPQADAARMAKGLAQYLNKLIAASDSNEKMNTSH